MILIFAIQIFEMHKKTIKTDEKKVYYNHTYFTLDIPDLS